MTTKHTAYLKMSTLPVGPPRIPSRPIDPSEPSLLDLPSEVQNMIYAYLFDFPTPIEVTFHQCRPMADRRCRFVLGHGVEFHWQLLSTCRSIFFDAATTFYANNTFHLMDDTAAACFPMIFIEMPIVFLRALGHQARWVRKVILDLAGVSLDGCYGIRENGPVFDEEHDIYEVMPLLRFLWDHDLRVNISFVQEGVPPPPWATQELWFDTSAMNRVIRCILEGQLHLRHCGPLLSAIGLKRDGSGGMLCLSRVVSPARSKHRFSVRRQARFEPDRDQVVSFIAEDEGSRLRIQPRASPLTLLGLPSGILGSIITEALCYKEAIPLNLDTDTKLPLGFPHINVDLYYEYYRRSMLENSYILSLSTNETACTFENFRKVTRLLRKEFALPWGKGKADPNQRWTIEDAKHHQIVLDFKLEKATALRELRVSILPLVLEMSSTIGDSELTVRSWARGSDGQHRIDSEHTITFQELRLSVAQALMGFKCGNNSTWAPEVWIDGIGQVIETRTHQQTTWDDAVDTASTLERDEDGYWRIEHMHVKDWLYRDCQNRGDCIFEGTGQFFPFSNSLHEALRYLLWILKSRHPNFSLRAQ
jgi:hypothetical protein